ncbi:MAG: methyltransferase domain-containing protein [Acetobacteraceae bacterium]|nr:methyltransferase domain-containing protein [Acetobacteraceae bacterium]
MGADAAKTADFYISSRGAAAASLVQARLRNIWPAVRGEAVLGVGYAIPYLLLWRDSAARCIAAIPEQFGPYRWPPAGPNICCATEQDCLPFPDLTFDRVLVVHGLETAGNARRLLRETWRVLKDSGRLLVIAANRNGLWAHSETTPFGQGQPYSPEQIGALLEDTFFRVERRDSALFVPPTGFPPLLKGALVIERAGRRVAPRFAGVTITEAVKDAYGVIPLAATARRGLVLSGAS